MSAAFGPYRMWPASPIGSHSIPNFRHRRRYAGSPLAGNSSLSASFFTTAMNASEPPVKSAGSTSFPSGVRTRYRSSPAGFGGAAASRVISRDSSLSGWPFARTVNALYQPNGEAVTSYLPFRIPANDARALRDGPGAANDPLRCAYG